MMESYIIEKINQKKTSVAILLRVDLWKMEKKNLPEGRRERDQANSVSNVFQVAFLSTEGRRQGGVEGLVNVEHVCQKLVGKTIGLASWAQIRESLHSTLNGYAIDFVMALINEKLVYL